MAGKIIADTIQAAGDRITFNVGEITVMTANSAGLTYIPTANVNLNIANPGSITVGNLTVTSNIILTGTLTNGIKFPASQVSSADANTLDDYEEGTWTPTDGSGANLTFSSTRANYTKIGRMVAASFVVIFPSTANTSYLQISGLPYTITNSGAGNGTDHGFSATIAYNDSGRNDAVVGYTGTTSMICWLISSSPTRATNANYSGKILEGTLIYFTAT